MVLLAILTAALVASAAGPVAAKPVEAAVQSGRLGGSSDGRVDAYLGIPYAQPPVGALRWRAPQPVAAWRGARPATRFSASCYQVPWSPPASPWTHEYIDHTPVSEDCLYLNVWAPRRDGKPRPVVVWIHGGGFIGGGSSAPVYDGHALAERGVVVVSINYRLGAFGFFAHPELTREAGGDPPANWGLQDVVAALRWVRGNIAAFGGDPGQVTIAGQSAGSMIVHDLLAAPRTQGLFERAIAESGLPSDEPAAPLARAEAAGLAFQHAAGARSLEELRAMPADRLAAVAAPSRPLPVVDGVLLPAAPDQAARQGRTQDVPLLLGFNADEHAVLGPAPPTPDKAAFHKLFADRYGADASALAAGYADSTSAERAASLKALARDEGAAAVIALATASGQRRAPVYAYLFAHAEPGPEAGRWGAFHSSEIPYAYGTLNKAPERPFTSADHRLSAEMTSYWADFIRTGDPNGDDLPRWPALTAADPRFLVLDIPVHAEAILSEARLRAFENAYKAGTDLKVLH